MEAVESKAVSEAVSEAVVSKAVVSKAVVSGIGSESVCSSIYLAIYNCYYAYAMAVKISAYIIVKVLEESTSVLRALGGEPLVLMTEYYLGVYCG